MIHTQMAILTISLSSKIASSEIQKHFYLKSFVHTREKYLSRSINKRGCVCIHNLLIHSGIASFKFRSRYYRVGIMNEGLNVLDISPL